MIRVIVIGAEGFVGSAFVSYLANRPGLEVVEVTRRNYAQSVGMASDVVIDASCNSRKYLADENPVEEFDLSVAHRLHTLRDFPTGMHAHISSVDVYSELSSPETTREDAPVDLAKVSRYGLHKFLAEQLVRHYAHRWLIVRLAGMVGPGLRKNPIYDILHCQPLRIHPDSKYQFMTTGDVARIVWMLVEKEIGGEVFNVSGDGLISPSEIARLAGLELDLSLLEPFAQPRIVCASIEKLKQITQPTNTLHSITMFINRWRGFDPPFGHGVTS